MNNLVCLCGERRRGKDYLTKGLIEEFGAIRVSFSDEVRRTAALLFPWFPAFDISDDEKDQVFVHPYNTQNATARDILLMAGKVRDVDGRYFVRNFIDNQFVNVLANPDKLYVITDFRTRDEYEGFLEIMKVPTIKILKDVDKDKYPDHPFEDYIRAFNKQQAAFFNSLPGTKAFVEFFKVFAQENGVANVA